LSDTDMEVWQA